MAIKVDLNAPEQLKPLPNFPLLPLSIVTLKDINGNTKFGFTTGGDMARGPDVLVHIPGNTAFVAGPGANSAPEREDLKIVGSMFEVVAAKMSDPAPYHSRPRENVVFLLQHLDELAEMLRERMFAKRLEAAKAAPVATIVEAPKPKKA